MYLSILNVVNTIGNLLWNKLHYFTLFLYKDLICNICRGSWVPATFLHPGCLVMVVKPMWAWLPVYRDKGTPNKKGGGLVLLLQNYPHPLCLRGRGPYHFPTPLNT